MLTSVLNNKIINCIDGIYSKDQLKSWSKKGILKCPVCGKSYEYCHGQIKMPYFRHKDKNMCEAKYIESETQEHLKGKRDLFRWIKNMPGTYDVVLEGWVPGTKQRPDIMFKYDSEQYVIEYQCTPIASEYFERHSLYQAAGIKDIWILGAKNYFEEYYIGRSRKRLNTIETFANTLYYDTDLKMLMMAVHDCLIKKIPNKKFLYYKKYRYDNNKNNFIRIKSMYYDYEYKWTCDPIMLTNLTNDEKDEMRYSHGKYGKYGNCSTACCKKLKDIDSLDYLFNTDLWIKK